ncbi:2Fe-2S iron-sulfur cluster binding domain-containing protein [Pseudonocardia sp. WMMC193]|uniref:2Fe-2S iron-sulfur cluster-binding protein n=1 Tax=Pseudonocardia sp. WMMC193 TaxID=2911965 RepID=UPI001F1904AF|nr:2Fe-2S iron-sulfur cluster binding domain-containing protein [Pseudonocardia sp. WMMC193]MCF7550874.1 2Fe-2S iron-sulfur cluster binding domain-containing protein [Pseudonocardia sp. WMMC193]
MGLFGRNREPATVTIRPSGRSFPATGKDSLLNEALAAGIPFPHSCTVGTCGTCKSKLVSGKVREITDAAITLSSEELADRYILPCQSLARGAVELHVADLVDMPDHPLVHTSAVLSGTRALTHDILEVVVRVDEPFAYTAGQYAELRVPGISGPRSYSFARGAADRAKDELVFYIRRTPGGEFTEWLFAEDRSGTALEVAGPFGNLWLRPSGAPALCVAGGSGLAPIKAILEAAADEGAQRETIVVFGARTARDLYCVEEIEAAAAAMAGSCRFVPVLSEEDPGSDWSGARGLVTDVVAALPADVLSACEVYACGPPPMVDALEAQLGALRADGVFHADRFLDKKTQRRS